MLFLLSAEASVRIACEYSGGIGSATPMVVDLGVLLPSTEAERAIFSNCLGGGTRQLAGRSLMESGRAA
jgi:hypothetical protein